MKVRKRKSPRERVRILIAKEMDLRKGWVHAEAAEHEVAERLRVYSKVKSWKDLSDAEVRGKAGRRFESWEIHLICLEVYDRFWAEDRRRLAELHWVQHQIATLARVVKIEPGEDWSQYRKIYGGSYSTQGLGADTYARGAAELEAVQIEIKTGIKARVRKIEIPRPANPGWHYVHTSDYVVEVQVREGLDLKLIQYAPSIPIRDFMKACWSRGLNPRVYQPFLPYGLEAKLGIDYMGNDLKTKVDP